MKKSLIAMTVAMAVMAGSAHAERAHARQSFTSDRTHTNANGGVSSRHVNQTATASGFTRNKVKTAPNGKTATHGTAVVNDAEAGTHARTVDGTTFGGKTYSGESLTTKTDNGYLREGSRTGVNGKTGTRSADVAVDRENGTLTKNISATGPNGQTSSTTVVRQLNTVETSGETSVE